MSTPAVNTKVELVVEAIEDIAVAVMARDHEAVLAARKMAADALRDFLVPTLRIVSRNNDIP